MSKQITIRSWRHGQSLDYTGTIQELVTDVFDYTLECGHSWNQKINRHPKTAKSLVKALNQSKEEMGGGYARTFYELITA